MSDLLGERIGHALAARRPQPSSDFEARLERAVQPTPSRMTGMLALAAAACAIVVVVITRPGREPETIERPERPAVQPPRRAAPAPTLVHDGKYTANQCSQCHRPARPSAPGVHEPKGTFPLDTWHGGVPCTSCHVPNKPLQRDCKSCHPPAKP